MPTAFAIASVEPPSSPRAANSARAASRICSRRSSALLRGEVTAMGGMLATSHLLCQEGHSSGQADGFSALLAGKAGESVSRIDIVRDQLAAWPQMRPGGMKLEPHALEGV